VTSSHAGCLVPRKDTTDRWAGARACRTPNKYIMWDLRFSKELWTGGGGMCRHPAVATQSAPQFRLSCHCSPSYTSDIPVRPWLEDWLYGSYVWGDVYEIKVVELRHEWLNVTFVFCAVTGVFGSLTLIFIKHRLYYERIDGNWLRFEDSDSRALVKIWPSHHRQLHAVRSRQLFASRELVGTIKLPVCHCYTLGSNMSRKSTSSFSSSHIRDHTALSSFSDPLSTMMNALVRDNVWLGGHFVYISFDSFLFADVLVWWKYKTGSHRIYQWVWRGILICISGLSSVPWNYILNFNGIFYWTK
jgi:hypothetical protein